MTHSTLCRMGHKSSTQLIKQSTGLVTRAVQCIFYVKVNSEITIICQFSLSLSHMQRAEMRMVRWMCNVKVKDRVPSKELRERLGIDDIILIVQQNRLQWYGHVLRKEDTDWVKKCLEYEVEGSRPRGRPKRTWREVVQNDCQTRNLNKEYAMNRGRWKKLIKTG